MYRVPTMTVMARTERSNASVTGSAARVADRRLLAHCELPFQQLGTRRPQETEADGAMLAGCRMMQPMRLDDPLHVAGTGNVTVPDALVHDHVMEAKVNGPVGCDACPDPR